MRFHLSSTSRILGIIGVAGLIVAAVPGIAEAAPHDGGNFTCTGSLSSPGTLAGNYANVYVAGVCLVDAGNVTVNGNLMVGPGASLVADFGQNDLTQSGTSNLTVRGNMAVLQGASVLMGCYPRMVTLWGEGPSGPNLFTTPDFPCDDDPLAFPASGNSAPTLSATETIGGNLTADDALGVVVHNTTIRGNVVSNGGGGGLAFNPQGIFAQYIPSGPPAGPGQLDTEPFQLPAYNDYTTNTIGGNLTVTGTTVNWYGIIGNTVRGNLTDTNNTSSPDGNETINNTVYGNLVCFGNNPGVEYGDSNGGPNEVGGNATGQCAFSVMIPNPSPDSVPGLPSYPLDPVSVHLH
jgi:hypothetical protein